MQILISYQNCQRSGLDAKNAKESHAPLKNKPSYSFQIKVDLIVYTTLTKSQI